MVAVVVSGNPAGLTSVSGSRRSQALLGSRSDQGFENPFDQEAMHQLLLLHRSFWADSSNCKSTNSRSND
jgi:hypothetical protein